MAQDKQLSPEKQLLELIEKSKMQQQKTQSPAPQGAAVAEASSAGRVAAKAIQRHGASLLSLDVLRARVSFLKNKFAKAEGLPHLEVSTINSILRICVIGMTLYFFLNLYFSWEGLNKKVDFKSNTRPSLTNASQVASPLKSVAYYLDKARERDLFSLEGKKDAGTQESVLAIREATAHLRLVGVAWSSDPDAMIEDTIKQKTLFLKKGQMVDNDIKVEAILKDKVILSYKGSQVDLK